MSDEKMKILKLIENNEITPAEGLELINQLDEKEKLNEDLSNDNFNEREALREKRIEERANEREKRNEERAKDRLERDREKLEKDKKKIEIDIESIKNEAINMGKEIKENLDMSFIKEAVNNAVSSINPIEVSDDTEFDDDKETRDYNIAQEFSLNCDTKKEIVVTVISTDINIVTEEREDILVKYISYSNKDTSNLKVMVEEDSKTIKISEKKREDANLFNFSSGGKELLIRLPRKYKESLSIKTVSGDLDINYLDSDSFRFSSVSGDMEADIIYSVNSLIKTTSGDCIINLFRGNMMFSSVSGDIDMKYEQLDGDFTMKSVSGDAGLKLPKNSEFEVVAKTLSGDINCDFPLVIIGSSKRGRLRGQVGSDEYTISASTTSGDLNISRY